MSPRLHPPPRFERVALALVLLPAALLVMACDQPAAAIPKRPTPSTFTIQAIADNPRFQLGDYDLPEIPVEFYEVQAPFYLHVVAYDERITGVTIEGKDHDFPWDGNGIIYPLERRYMTLGCQTRKVSVTIRSDHFPATTGSVDLGSGKFVHIHLDAADQLVVGQCAQSSEYDLAPQKTE